MYGYIVQETSLWGDAYKATTAEEVLRCGQKRELLHTASHLFLDHYRIYGVKPAIQRLPLAERQTFIVSYVYTYDEFIGARELEFTEKLTSMQLRFYKEPCIFRGKDAYKIFIVDTGVDLEAVVRMV
jgi:hypothetical protein